MKNTQKQKEERDQAWETIKPDAKNLYMQQGKRLTDTMAAIKSIHGFNACERTWKQRIGEWDFKKNQSRSDMEWIAKKAEKRKLEGKDTSFFSNNFEIKEEKIENFKRKKLVAASFGVDVATPPHITYRTPSYGQSNEAEDDASFSMSNSTAVLDGSNGLPDFEIQTKTPMTHSRLDQYLVDPNRPWSPYTKVCPARHTELFGRSYLTPALAIGDVVLHELSCIQWQMKCEDSVMRTLDKDAENDCLRVLEHGGSQVVIQTFLGLVYLKGSCVRKATSTLCSALTDFILHFTSNDIEWNSCSLEAIDDLFSQLAAQNEQEWSSLALCLRQMTSTLNEAFHSGTIELVFPKLVLHGISFAGALYLLEDLNETNYAEQMYELLLKPSSGTDFSLHEIEFARAHHEYALLLKKEGKWLECAEQLIQAYQLAAYNESRNSQLIACLRYECLDVFQHFSSGKDESVILDKLTKMLTRMDRKNEDNSDDGQPSPLREYLQSESPFALNEDLERVSIDTGLPAQEVRKEKSKTSTSSHSKSSSHKYGLTFSESDITGISNSEFYTAY